MPTYVAFLRAINLGSTRKVPKADILTATEAAGGTDVETYINTGNVRLTHSARSVGKVQAALERAYGEQAGFEVPTIVFTTSDLRALTERGDALHEEHAPQGKHYVTLYVDPPPAGARKEVEALDIPGERCVVEGRAAYCLLDGNIHNSKLLASKQFAALGKGTARTIQVLRTVTEKWC